VEYLQEDAALVLVKEGGKLKGESIFDADS